MSDKPTAAEVVDKLITIGSAEQIALFFEEQGIKGEVASSSSCAIAEYVKLATGEGLVHSFWGQVTVCDPIEGSSAGTTRERVSHESVLLDNFMAKFDNGCYPNLIK